MPYVTVGKENSSNIEIYYKDWGSGQPVVFSHGWPLSSDAFEDQMFYLASRGYRCIAHDRRGYGMCTTLKDKVNEDLLAFIRS
jgi:non-heme chloroperoxidase